VFGNERVAEAISMSHRAPLDLRVNTLSADRDRVRASLRHLRAEPTPWSPIGLRILLDADARSPGIQAEPDFIKGAIEVQDEGSQLAALFADAREGESVVDLCAGAGGKTLALAAAMRGRGRLIATDSDKRQLAPIHERLKRAGVHNVEVRTPKGNDDPLSDLAGRCDIVVIDAPCTGTGTWRRNPDAKWRMRPGALDIRIKDQVEVLDRAVPLLKRGGRIAYITCSVLQEENSDQISAFIARHNDFVPVPPTEVAAKLGQSAKGFCDSVRLFDEGLLMTPHRTGTDGFFVALLKRPQ
jgi:16S rRNA (cytosine967-C5)-methyltransferase